MTPLATNLLGQVGAQAIAADATHELFSGPVDRYSALRFLLVFGGAGTVQLQLVWMTPVGSTIQAAVETVTLTNDYAEVPVRAPRITVNLVETASSPATATGTALGVVEA